MIVALTLTPNDRDAIPLPRPPHFLQQLGDGRLIWSKIVTPPDDAEEVANIAIYLPAGILGLFVWGSVGRATSFGLVLAVFVETCQYGVIGRAGIDHGYPQQRPGRLFRRSARPRRLFSAGAVARTRPPNSTLAGPVTTSAMPPRVLL